MTDHPLLEVKNLSTSFGSRRGPVHAVQDVSFQIGRGEALAIVGESGSGKSATALSIVGLLPPNGRVTGGSILLDGMDLVSSPPPVMKKVRGARVVVVFQDSMTSLNPVLTIGIQIAESLHRHTDLSDREVMARSVELLGEVGISDPERRLKQYPHQLSGGLRQRVAIAIALAPDPDILIADEPTTALDVTVQAQVLDLLMRERRRRDMAMLLITHDLGVVSSVADRIVIMYSGRIVERGSTAEILRSPKHPYTRGLLEAVPHLGARRMGRRLVPIPGVPPSPWSVSEGCDFSTRCSYAIDRCFTERPALELVNGTGRESACWLVKEGSEPW